MLEQVMHQKTGNLTVNKKDNYNNTIACSEQQYTVGLVSDNLQNLIVILISALPNTHKFILSIAKVNKINTHTLHS
jgi:hypothetical protein